MTGAAVAGREGERGMALLVVMWTLLLLGLIAASLGVEARKQGFLARNAEALARAEAAAEGGVVRGVAALIDVRADRRWLADGAPHRFVLDGIGIEVRIVDEAGKVDLNTGPPELLAALLQVVGADAETALFVADGVVRLRTAAGVGQAGVFETTAELLSVPGITPRVFDRVSPFVTVLTHAPGVDPSVAPRAVLVALAGGGPTGRAFSEIGDGPEAPPVSATGGFVTELQHSVYAISAVAIAGPARFARQAIVRLTHSADMPFLVHTWQRLPADPASASGPDRRLSAGG